MNTLPLFPQDDNPILKRCSKCPNSYPATFEFFPKNNKGMLAAWCKACTREYRKQHYKENKQKVSQQGKQYYHENKAEVRKRQIQYEEANKDKIHARRERYKVTRKEIERERNRRRYYTQGYREYRKRYEEKNKEQFLEYGKHYRRDNKKELGDKKKRYRQTEKGMLVERVHRERRRSQKLASKGHYTAQDIQEQYNRQRESCYYCRKKLHKKYHIDHVAPLSKGGSNDIHNIVLACPSCNLSKSDKLLHQWRNGGRLL